MSHVFTVSDLCYRNVEQRPIQTALVSRGAQLTYGELGARVDAWAAWLESAGVQRGDRVGIHLPKGFEEVTALFAIARVGAVFVNINYQWTTRQLTYILNDCQIKVLITDRPRAKRAHAEGALDELSIVLVVGDSTDIPRAVSVTALQAGARPHTCGPISNDLAALLYTSGSTGRPKGVMLSHRNIVDGARSVSTYLKNTEHDRTLSVLPLSFDYGMSQLTTMFLVGGSMALAPSVMPAEIVNAILQNHVTGLAAVPPTWVQLVHYLVENPARFPALRYVTNSGGKIPPAVLESMPTVFPDVAIYLMYGLTEAFRSTWLPPELFHEKMGSIGKAIPDNEVFVVGEHSVCGPDEPGELVHRGSLVSLGYWGDPDATAARIRSCPQLKSLIGDEKVCFSGDLVRMDTEGYLWFVGRADSMIKCSGFRISPTEVEDLVHESGHVSEVVAFGVEDDELGQVVHVVVSPRAAQVGVAELLRDHCRRTMPSYMIPRKIHLWTGLMPRTSSGKIDRNQVIEAVRVRTEDISPANC